MDVATFEVRIRLRTTGQGSPFYTPLRGIKGPLWLMKCCSTLPNADAMLTYFSLADAMLSLHFLRLMKCYFRYLQTQEHTSICQDLMKFCTTFPQIREHKSICQDLMKYCTRFPQIEEHKSICQDLMEYCTTFPQTKPGVLIEWLMKY